MRQSNEDFLSLYRLGVNELNRAFSPKISLLSQVFIQSIFFMPLTHEEGHRSILTNEGIGAISKPYINKNMAAYVTGVSDKTLVDLRNNNLPVAVRTYTGGLESDYMLLLRENSLLNFEQESMRVLWMEYLIRKFSMVSYYAMGLFNYNLDIKQESNELNRDIAGMDVYGAIRALHNPDMEFKRYVDFRDLQPDEKQFLKRVGWRSFINLIDPTLFLKTAFTIRNKYLVNFNLGYSMSPFGDFIDEHFWVKTNYLKTHFYFRQYENKDNLFPAFGIDVNDIHPFKNAYATIAFHGWQQPENLSFTQTKGKSGGAIDLLFKYRFNVRTESQFSGISLNVGVIAKTQGFLPEEVEMDKHLGFRLGTSVWLK
jgi:hypothetical protein